MFKQGSAHSLPLVPSLIFTLSNFYSCSPLLASFLWSFWILSPSSIVKNMFSNPSPTFIVNPVSWRVWWYWWKMDANIQTVLWSLKSKTVTLNSVFRLSVFTPGLGNLVNSDPRIYCQNHILWGYGVNLMCCNSLWIIAVTMTPVPISSFFFRCM